MNKTIQLTPTLFTLLCSIFYVFINNKLEIPVEPGDAISHFFYSKNALTDSTLYLHHWAKPLFTLFSSPFTIFGLKGVIFMNIILFTLTSLIGIQILKKLDVAVFLQLAFPMLLIQTPDYNFTVIAGLTEPLFAFLVVLSSYLLLEKKWVFFAIIISFLPFSRSEGQYLVVLAFIALCYYKQFKYIPLLVFGFIIYAIIGQILINDYLWYFHDDPYNGVSVYGKGEWSHFWDNRKASLGTIGLIMMGFGILGFIAIFIRTHAKKFNWTFLIWCQAIFWGITLVHAYLWVKGDHASAGLTRVIQQGVPIYFISILHLINVLFLQRNTYYQIFFFLPFIGSTVSFFFNNGYLKYRISGMDEVVINATNFVNKHKKDNTTVYYFHPLAAYLSDAQNPKNKDKYIQRYFNNVTYDVSVMNEGDFVIRDSHFGPVEQGLPLDSITNNKRLVLVKEFHPSVIGFNANGEKAGCKVFQVINEENQIKTRDKISNVSLNKTYKGKDRIVKIFDTIVPTQQLISFNIHVETEANILEVNQYFAERKDNKTEIVTGNNLIEYNLYPNEYSKIYLLNKKNKPLKLKITNLTFIEKHFHPIR